MKMMNEHNVVTDERALELRVDRPVVKPVALPAMPERVYAAASLVDPLPAPLLETLGKLELTEEQISILTAPVPDDEYDILPDDKGLVYVRHEYIRQRLIQAFGPCGWTMIEVSPFVKGPGHGTERWYQKWALVIKGVFVGAAMSSADYNDDNNMATMDNTSEIIQSDCIRRIGGKTLGIGLEAWNPRVQKRIRDTCCIQVDVLRKGSLVKIWRRKDAGPITGENEKPVSCPKCGKPLLRSKFLDVNGELGWYCFKNTGGCSTQYTKREIDGEPESPKPEPKVAVKPDNRVKVAEVQRQKPKAVAPKAEPKPNPAPVPTADGPISDGQVRLLKTLFAQTALVEGDDWNAAIAHLSSTLEGEIVLDDDKSSMANFEAILRTVPKSKLNGLLKTAQAMKAEKAERKEEQNNAETDN